MTARYEGTPLVEFLGDGRNVRLKSNFSFIDKNDVTWGVSEGWVVDGASIPKIFWSLVGGPYEGKYRNASIIHDYYCDVRSRSWQDTHMVFYDAMICSEVPDRLAKILYFAVRWGGPRWEERVSVDINSILNKIKSKESEVNRIEFMNMGNNSASDVSRPEIKGGGGEVGLDSVAVEGGEGDAGGEVGGRSLVKIAEAESGGDFYISVNKEYIDSPMYSFEDSQRIDLFNEIIENINFNDISISAIDKLADKIVIAPAVVRNINMGLSGDPNLEENILDEVGSYGRQIGRIADVISVVLGKIDRDNCTASEVDSIVAFSQMYNSILKLKNRSDAVLSSEKPVPLVR